MIGNCASLMFFEFFKFKNWGGCVEQFQFRNVHRLLEYSDQQDA